MVYSHRLGDADRHELAYSYGLGNSNRPLDAGAKVSHCDASLMDVNPNMDFHPDRDGHPDLDCHFNSSNGNVNFNRQSDPDTYPNIDAYIAAGCSNFRL